MARPTRATHRRAARRILGPCRPELRRYPYLTNVVGPNADQLGHRPLGHHRLRDLGARRRRSSHRQHRPGHQLPVSRSAPSSPTSGRRPTLTATVLLSGVPGRDRPAGYRSGAAVLDATAGGQSHAVLVCGVRRLGMVDATGINPDQANVMARIATSGARCLHHRRQRLSGGQPEK